MRDPERIYGAEPKLMKAIETVRAAGLDVHLTGTLAVGTPGARLIAIPEQPAHQHESADIEWVHSHKGTFRGRVVRMLGDFCDIEFTEPGSLHLFSPGADGSFEPGDVRRFRCSFLTPDPRQLP